jgi:hypothetical protein
VKAGLFWIGRMGRIVSLCAVLGASATASANAVFDANFVHKTHPDSISFNSSEIHHPFTDGKPGEMLFVTPNANPSGSVILDFYNLGVWYDGPLGTNRWNVFHQNAATAMIDGASFNVLVPHPDADAFVHEADAGNITGNYTLIDHAGINGDPDALVIVTQNWNPPASAGVYNDHAIGVFYSAAALKWAIFNQDVAAMPVGAAFNVLVLDDLRWSHLHSADALNTTGNRTFIDHPALNGNPDALVQVTPNWNPGNSTGVYNDHPVGVFYDSSQQRWAITNLDGLSIPLGADFNVLIPPEDETFWVHGSAPVNLGPGTTTLSHPRVDDELSPILLTTPNLDFDGASGYPLDPTAVGYDSLLGHWYLRNQFGPSWAADTFTNVYHPPINLRTFVHQAEVGSMLQYTVFRHPLTDFDTDALIFVQPHMNPADGPLVLILDRVGVAWFDCAVLPGCTGSGAVWTVQTEFNTHAIADNSSYNIHVSSPEEGAFKQTVLSTDPNFTVLDHPDLNGDPDVGILVTHNISDSNDYLDKTVGVRYDQGLARWTIRTVDNSDLPTGHVFNVLPLPEPDGPLSLGAGVVLLGLLGRRFRRRRR